MWLKRFGCISIPRGLFSLSATVAARYMGRYHGPPLSSLVVPLSTYVHTVHVIHVIRRWIYIYSVDIYCCVYHTDR